MAKRKNEEEYDTGEMEQEDINSAIMSEIEQDLEIVRKNQKKKNEPRVRVREELFQKEKPAGKSSKIGDLSISDDLEDRVFSRLEGRETEEDTPVDEEEQDSMEIPYLEEEEDLEEGQPEKNEKIPSEISLLRGKIDSLMSKIKKGEKFGPAKPAPQKVPVKDRFLNDMDEQLALYSKVARAEQDGAGNQAIKSEVDNMLSGLKRIPLEKEIRFFGNLIMNNRFLSFLKPRFSEILSRGQLDHSVLVGLYRIAARILEDEVAKKATDLDLARKKVQSLKNNTRLLEEVVEASKHRSEDDDPNKTRILELYESDEIDIQTKFFSEKEVRKYQAELEQKDKEITRLEHQMKRLREDFKNFRTRQQKEVDRLVVESKEKVFLELLTVVDNFDRALDASRNTANVMAIIQGFQLIHEEFGKILKKFEIKEIPALEKSFDPFYHEALMRKSVDDMPDSMVTMVLRKGYMLGEKVMRPTQVQTSDNPKWVLDEPIPVFEEEDEEEDGEKEPVDDSIKSLQDEIKQHLKKEEVPKNEKVPASEEEKPLKEENMEKEPKKTIEKPAVVKDEPEVDSRPIERNMPDKTKVKAEAVREPAEESLKTEKAENDEDFSEMNLYDE